MSQINVFNILLCANYLHFYSYNLLGRIKENLILHYKISQMRYELLKLCVIKNIDIYKEV